MLVCSVPGGVATREGVCEINDDDGLYFGYQVSASLSNFVKVNDWPKLFAQPFIIWIPHTVDSSHTKYGLFIPFLA